MILHTNDWELAEAAMLAERKRALVVFDVEGVLFPKKRYLFFEVGKKVGFIGFLRIIFYGLLYELGLISLKSALQHLFKLFEGLRAEELLRIFRQAPLIPGAEEVFEKLRNDGWKTELISSGLPTFVIQDLAGTLKADYAYGFDLQTKDGVLTGEIWGDVIDREGKLRVLAKVLRIEKLSPKDCVVVADDRNNRSMFLPEMLKIGYNPDFAIRVKADRVVNGKLMDILPAINGKAEQRRGLPTRNEAVREAIHACGFLVPILASLIGLYRVALLIVVVTLFYIMSELARMERKNLPLISFITRHATSQAELYEFTTAPIFFALGILFTLLVFPYPANAAAIMMFALGDSTASIFGKIFGKKTLPFNKGKTLEGSVIGFVFAFLAGILLISPSKALVAAAIAMVIEGLPLPLNHNIATPIVTGAVLTLMT